MPENNILRSIKTFQLNLMQIFSQDITDVGEGFRALGDPLRIKIIELLRNQELCVCELCEKLNVSQSKLSFHLKNLKEANLIRSRQESRWMYYSLNLAQFVVLEQYLAEYRRLGEILPAKSCN
jgi:ArsR family transcriptional regulator, arsenate/arsenite/antimonite-responsive transcriptional repressor